jgi:uncharacterized membrane protein (UPF0127 family)
MHGELVIYKANTFWERLRGLLGRRMLDANEALHIQPCSDVHSFGMKYPLDILFLDKAGHVLKADVLKPNSWLFCKGATSVLEFKAGCSQAFDSAEVIVRKSIGERHEQ